MIGTDGHTSTITGDIPAMKNIKLVAYARHDNTNVKIPSDVKVYKEYEEMLDREQLDIVGICLPYYLNATASIAAAQRKIHIMTEKPVATTLDDLERLFKAVTANRVRLTTLLSMRLDPQYQAIRETIAAGKIGEPILATAQKSYKFGKNRPETAPTHGDDRLRIIGSGGVLEIKDGGQRVELISSAADAVDIQLPERKSFLADFIAELRGQGKHVLAPEEPFEMTRVALLAHRSAEQKRIITL